MTALLKFLRVLILGALAIAIADAFIGVGYWQYTRQAELLDGFEYMAWDSDHQSQIETLEDGEGQEFKVMRLARRYSDHWIVSWANPDGYRSKKSGKELTNRFSIRVHWDRDSESGSEIDTGEIYGSGEPLLLECADRNKLTWARSSGKKDASTPWESIPEFEMEFDGFKADFSGLKYWPWDEAKKFATLQKATMSSDTD